VDSSVVAALAAQAVGPQRVIGLLLPEPESSDDSLVLGQQLASALGIRAIVEDIGAILAGSRLLSATGRGRAQRCA
jgi:NAD+ synthase